MPKFIARLMNDDGKYHYGSWTVPAPHAGPLFQINVQGTGALPPAPTQPATPAEHAQWIASLKATGATVDVVQIDEPKD